MNLRGYKELIGIIVEAIETIDKEINTLQNADDQAKKLFVEKKALELVMEIERNFSIVLHIEPENNTTSLYFPMGDQ